LRLNDCCCGKVKINTYSECVSVALGIQYANRIRHSVVCALYSCIIFFALSCKWKDFRKKIIVHNMCALIFCTNFIQDFFILSRIQRDITNYRGLYAKCPLLFQVLIKIEFSRQILEKSSSINLINSFQWKLRCCMRTERQSDKQSWWR